MRAAPERPARPRPGDLPRGARPLPISPADVRVLQRTAGNRAVSAILSHTARGRAQACAAGVLQRVLLAVDGVVSEVPSLPTGKQYRPISEQKWRYYYLPAWLGNQNLGHVYEEVPKAKLGDNPLVDRPTGLKDLHLNRVDLASDEKSFGHLIGMHTLEKLELTNCVLPDGWSGMFGGLPNLVYVSITSGKIPTPSDGLAPLQRLAGLKVLRLIRAEFMDARCYNDLRQLTGLSYVDLRRTVTKEKSPGRKAKVEVDEGRRSIERVVDLDDAVMRCLMHLASTVQTLDLTNCSALSRDDLAAIDDMARRAGAGCRVIHDGE
jgi:hypothetical protein